MVVVVVVVGTLSECARKPLRASHLHICLENQGCPNKLMKGLACRSARESLGHAIF